MQILDILYIPRLKKNLLSIAQFTKIGYTKIKFINNICIIIIKSPYFGEVHCLSISKQDNLYFLGLGVLPTLSLPHIYKNKHHCLISTNNSSQNQTTSFFVPIVNHARI